MFTAFLKAFAQLFSPGFRWVLLKSLALTVLLFLGAGFAIRAAFQNIAFVQWDWLETTIEVLAGLGLVVGMVFLIGPITAIFAGLFLDRVAEQVEQKHYPNDPPGQDPPMASSMWTAAWFAVVILVVNVFVLLIAWLPGLNVVAYLAGNGYLLGREYFQLVGARFHHPRDVKALRKANRGKVFTAGLFIAFVALIPFVNVLVPLFATAFMVHVYKGVQRRSGERPPKVSIRTGS